MNGKVTLLPIEGMRCAGCAATIEKKIRAIPGVDWVSVNYANKKALVRGTAGLEALCEAVEMAGYTVTFDKIQNSERERAVLHRQKIEASLAAAFSFPIFILSMGHFDSEWSRWGQFLMTLPVLYFGRAFFQGAWKNLKFHSATMDSLVALGTGAAFLYSVIGLYLRFPHLYFESAAVVISLVLLGRNLEERAKRRSSSALLELMSVTPQIVVLVTNQGKFTATQEIPVSQLQLGDLFLVRPGEVVATDGRVIEGISSVEESKLTGESAPKEKGVGSLVFGGTLNQNGRLIVQATALGEETRLAKLVRMVEEAQGTKPEIQRLADKISAIFVPVVLVIAGITLIAWLATGHSWVQSMMPSISVLVIACPCALGLATPTAVIIGIGSSADLGILIRDARSLEASHKVDVVLLDKTGTLTVGAPQVVESYYCPTGKSEMGLVAAIENQASHPLAKAISQHAKKFQADTSLDLMIEEFRNVPGLGCSGRVNGKNVFVGSRQWVESQGVNTVIDWIPHAVIEKIKQEGKTRVWASVDNHLTSVLILEDEIRPEAKEAVLALQKEASVRMVSGDNPEAVAKVARELGMTDWMAEVTPDQKAEEVKKLKAQGHQVAMIGDGVNDGPALALADVSFTLGTGTDLAKEVASITLVHGDLRQVTQALRISHLVMRVIKQNLFSAFFYNVISIPLAALGFLNPMIAGLAMAFSSISVVLNSYRLKGLIKNKS